MAIDPKTTREHIVSLYGYITGLRKDISQIKNNHSLLHFQVIALSELPKRFKDSLDQFHCKLLPLLLVFPTVFLQNSGTICAIIFLTCFTPSDESF